MNPFAILEPFIGAVVFILPFLLVLTVVVFVHELGHFLVARWCGVSVEVFSVGFGPALLSYTDGKGTRWQFSAIPLGGYVRFLGDDNVASTPDTEALARMSAEERSASFASKSVWARMAIVAAGPFANFLLAIAVFTMVFTVYGRDLVPPKVDEVMAGSAAEAAGILPGDVVLTINGATIASFADIQARIGTSAGREMVIELDRDGTEITTTAIPRRERITDPFGNEISVGILGISASANPDEIVHRTYPLPQAVGRAVWETWFVIDRSVRVAQGLIVGREPTDQLSGPIRIAQLSSQVATLGGLALLNWTALISVSIGFINLLPIPLLDGGHLAFFAAEAIRGKPLSERAQEIGFRLGFAVIGMLMIFAVWNDIMALDILRFFRV